MQFPPRNNNVKFMPSIGGFVPGPSQVKEFQICLCILFDLQSCSNVEILLWMVNFVYLWTLSFWRFPGFTFSSERGIIKCCHLCRVYFKGLFWSFPNTNFFYFLRVTWRFLINLVVGSASASGRGNFVHGCTSQSFMLTPDRTWGTVTWQCSHHWVVGSSAPVIKPKMPFFLKLFLTLVNLASWISPPFGFNRVERQRDFLPCYRSKVRSFVRSFHR